MITIVGGTYLEICEDPYSFELYGSGLRAATALSAVIEKIEYRSCVGELQIDSVISICNTFGIIHELVKTPKTFSFFYYHPLSTPVSFPTAYCKPFVDLQNIEGENILYYGMLEALPKVVGNYVVYDPQNGISFHETGSTAKHLAIVLNRNEALKLSGMHEGSDLASVATTLLTSNNADVVVIKNGANGAIVVEKSGIHIVPIFKTPSVWPIGSGDIFSAVFAWQWIFKGMSASDAALNASIYTAQYCANRMLPLKNELPNFESLEIKNRNRKVYLAGPFFSIGERWLVNEIRDTLLALGNEVFSPFHDVGLGDVKEIVEKDLAGITEADVVLAIVDGCDLGTIFEIGYARALGKKVVVFVENINPNDLTMIKGSGCEITSEMSTAIYWSSW